jgi:hypothetical protein
MKDQRKGLELCLLEQNDAYSVVALHTFQMTIDRAR